MKLFLQGILPAFVLLLAPHMPLWGAELKLAALFSDHMVLQREKPIPIWGWADAGAAVTVEFAGQHKTALADASGKWLLKFEPLPASAEPLKLVVRTAATGSSIEINDVLVGEVWLGSGQSNMAMTVARSRDYAQEQAAANLPLIRMFKEESGAAATPQADGKGEWQVCSPETVGSFSATLYFCGRELQRKLNVPVGLINSSVGGTPIESWIAAEAQVQVPQLKPLVEATLKTNAEYDFAAAQAKYKQTLARWNKQVAAARAAGQPLPKKPTDPAAQRNRRGGPGGLFNGKIAPLVPYALRGVLWYQGEANSQPGKGALYQYQLPALVRDWRTRWEEELPFAWVQLPNFEREGEDWMLVREGMLKTLSLPKTGMAITVDIGQPKDIHPKNKQDVGLRLAMWALGEVYGQKVAASSGPLPLGHKISDSQVTVTFSHAAEGLMAKNGEPIGFEIAGEDHQWKPAVARLTSDTVIVSSPQVAQPVAVRYAWAADPKCNLFNSAGLPASPFRTAEW